MKTHPAIFLLLGIFSLVSLMRAEEHRKPPAIETRDEQAERHAQDRQTIDALRRNGADLTKAHTVEHHFLSGDREKAQACAKDGIVAGYKASEISALKSETGGPYWSFDLTKPVVPSEENIFAESQRMTILGQKHGLVYDGWGCLAEK